MKTLIEEIIEDLKQAIKHSENVYKQLHNMPTNSAIIYEQKGKIDGLKLAILQVLQIAKESGIQTKYKFDNDGNEA